MLRVELSDVPKACPLLISKMVQPPEWPGAGTDVWRKRREQDG